MANVQDTYYRVSGDTVRWKDHDGEVVIRDESRSMTLSLNHSAARLWLRLVQGASVGDLVDELVGTYDVDRATAAVDVERFIAALSDHGLIADG